MEQHTTFELHYSWIYVKLFAGCTADWLASATLHYFILCLDGPHEAAGKQNANQLKEK